RCGVALVVIDKRHRERVNGLHLSHDIQTAPGVELCIHMSERFQPCPEPGTGTADPLGDRTYLAVPFGEQGDDPVGFTQLVHPQHNAGISVTAHQPSVSPRTGGARRRQYGYVGAADTKTIIQMMLKSQPTAPTIVETRHIVLVVFDASRAICRLPCIL